MKEPALNDLPALLAEATTPGAVTIDYRDRIAAFGVPAVDAMRGWLADGDLAKYAVRVLGKVGGPARDQAVALLVEATLTGAPATRGDAQAEILRLEQGHLLAADNETVVLGSGVDPDGRAFVRLSTRASKQRHFTLPTAVVKQLGLPTNPRVQLDVACCAKTFRVVTKTESKNEVYARGLDERTQDLNLVQPYERIEVTVRGAA
jgi:hypothetical protein